MANKVYEIIQEKFIQAIEEAIKTGAKLPWQQGWEGGRIPCNFVSRKNYRGVNLFLLPRDCSEFITWNQLCDLHKKNPDIKLKKGCKKHMIIYWNMIERALEKEDQENEDENETVKIPLLRYYYVYGINSVEGLESKFVKYEHDPKEEAENLIQSYVQRSGLDFRVVPGSGEAFYSPSKDYVQVPAKEQFKDLEEYYSTVFHELAHSTGAPGRLNRFSKEAGSGMFASESYSKEELVSELTVGFLNATLSLKGNTSNIGNGLSAVEKNSVAYLTGWLKKIKEDVSLIVEASAKAQKASDYIQGIAFEKSSDEEEVA